MIRRLVSLPAVIVTGVLLSAFRVSDPDDTRACRYCEHNLPADDGLLTFWVNDARLYAHEIMVHPHECRNTRGDARLPQRTTAPRSATASIAA